MTTTTVRVGVIVERQDSEWVPYTYKMFYCRSKDMGDDTHAPTSEWMRETISCLSYYGGLPGEQRLKIDERKRYWVHLTISGGYDYWGEWDDDIELHKVRPCK